MGDYDMRSEVTDCRFKNFSGVDEVGVQRADGIISLLFPDWRLSRKKRRNALFVVADVF